MADLGARLPGKSYPGDRTGITVDRSIYLRRPAVTATPAIAPSLARTPRSDLPLFVVGLLLVLVVVFAGFAPTFYLKSLFGTPPLSNLLFAHGLVMSTWIALLVAQTALVEFGRTDLHRRVGVAGAGVAALLVVIGVAAALEAARRGFSPTPKVTPLMFLAIPLVDLLVFSILVGTALAMRRKVAAHKRLMLLATVGMLTPAVARLPIDALKQAGLPAFFAVTIACVLLVVGFDAVRQRRLHPAFGWGAALVIAAVPGRIALAQSDAWVSIAGRLVAMLG
jgi:hypothetical protein